MKLFLSSLSLLLMAGASAAETGGVTSGQFAAVAYAALPLEAPMTFHRQLGEWVEPVHRDPGARATAEEEEITEDWSLVIPSTAGPVLRTVAAEFCTYLKNSMQVGIEVRTEASVSGWRREQKAIFAGTRTQLTGCGEGLAGNKDYQLMVAPGRVVVCGFDERGAMYGLYNLESRLNLRGAPFLPERLNTTRHSLYKTRMTLSGLGWDEWPDTYLAMLSRYGFDSIFASVYANPNGFDGPAPLWDVIRKQNPARIHDLIRRAGRYGIDLYCPIIYRYTGEPENEAGLRKLVHEIATEFPEIRGYVLLTEGFFYQTWFGAGQQGDLDLHQWLRGWARGVEVVTEECRKVNPAIEVLPWDYNIDFKPSWVEIKKFGTDVLPLDCIPLLTFENGKSFARDGEENWLRDYGINEIGPAEVTAGQIAVAQARKMRDVYAKVDTSACWQYGSFPYLPVPYQWYARYQALEKYGIHGTLESWSAGFQPSFVGEMRNWYSWSDAPSLDGLLRSMARQEFGAGSEDLVLAAWNHFSQAIRLQPERGGASRGTLLAVAAPLLFQRPPPEITSFVLPPPQHTWNDPAKRRSGTRLASRTPSWPWGNLLQPDFTNRVNAAKQYASPLTLPVFTKYLKLAADEMEQGLASYRRAALNAPAAKRPAAFREVLLAEQLERMMRGADAVLEFENMRFELANSADPGGRQALLDRMEALAKEELRRTRDSLATAQRDSRLGWETEHDYFYTPHSLELKIDQLQGAIDREIPAYRSSLAKAP